MIPNPSSLLGRREVVFVVIEPGNLMNRSSAILDDETDLAETSKRCFDVTLQQQDVKTR